MNARIKRSVVDERAVDRAIYKQLAANVKKLERNLCAMVLWRLHHYGKTRWGKKRLLAFYEEFRKDMKALEEYYEMTSSEDIEFLYKIMLKSETGIDIDALPEIMFDLGIRVKEG